MHQQDEKREKIFVGLSGGVDSSVSALLLKEAGHHVTGVFIKVWQPDGVPCTWRKDRLDAMRVCAALKIPFRTLDLSEEYKRDVVDVMISEYAAGRTPNPDILCNQNVKFGAFLDYARAEGADAIATGHYATICREGEPSVWTAADAGKDQTYFLWGLSEDQLRFIYFPVGDMEKGETRARAARAGLVTAKKPDSQGLCFIGKLDMKAFLHEYIPSKPGAVLLASGEKVGEHDGAFFYTLGERHGLRITKPEMKGPFYVVGKDVAHNTLTVDTKPIVHSDSGGQVVLRGVHWINDTPKENEPYVVRIRHRGSLVPARVRTHTGGGAAIDFIDTPPLVSSGQSLVVYGAADNAGRRRCVGGGIVV